MQITGELNQGTKRRLVLYQKVQHGITELYYETLEGLTGCVDSGNLHLIIFAVLCYLVCTCCARVLFGTIKPCARVVQL